MLRRVPALILFLVVLCLRAAQAQESLWATIRTDGERFADDVVHIWSSPFRADAKDFAVVGAVGAGLFGLGLFDDEIQDWIRDNPDALPVRMVGPFQHPRPTSLLGYTTYLLALSAALYAGGLAFDSDDLRDAGIGCATADISGTFARHLIARLIGRLRPEFTRDPYVLRPFAWGDWPMRSFPGGHVANIMACSAFWSNRFDLGIAAPVLYILGAAVGFARVVDQAHWTTDTAFGMFFGWAVGRAVAGRFNGRDGPSDDADAAARAMTRPRLTIGWRIAL